MTPTQTKILQILSDGMPHRFEELQQVLPDNLGNRQTLHNHLKLIRAKIRPRGEDIICQFILRQRQYRHVRLLHSANDGCR
jgi:hypothetical protein